MTCTFRNTKHISRRSPPVCGYRSETRADPEKIAKAVAVLRPLSWNATRTLSEQHANATAVLYESYGPMLRSVALQIVRARADAEDVVHDVFCRLPWVVGQYRNGGLGGWLKRITVSQALMHVRRSKSRREQRALDEIHMRPDIATTEMNLLEREHGDELRQALRQLSEPLRRVVILRFYLGYSHQEIAVALGIAPNASEVRLCRALKQLRYALDSGRASSSTTSRKPRERLAAARAS